MHVLRDALLESYSLWVQVYRSPLAVALIVAVAVVGWKKKLTVGKLVQAFLISAITAHFNPTAAFLSQEQHSWYDSFVQNFVNTSSPALIGVIQSWQLQNHVLSDQTATLAVTFYLVILIPELKWYIFPIWLAVVVAALTCLTMAMSFLLVRFAWPMMIPSPEQLDKMSLDSVLTAHRRAFEWWLSVPTWSAAWAMVAVVVSVAAFDYAKKHPIPKSLLVLNVIAPALLLSFALISLQILTLKAVLWIIFMFAAYVPALAATRCSLDADRSLLSFYVTGAKALLKRGQM